MSYNHISGRSHANRTRYDFHQQRSVIVGIERRRDRRNERGAERAEFSSRVANPQARVTERRAMRAKASLREEEERYPKELTSYLEPILDNSERREQVIKIIVEHGSDHQRVAGVVVDVLEYIGESPSEEDSEEEVAKGSKSDGEVQVPDSSTYERVPDKLGVATPNGDTNRKLYAAATELSSEEEIRVGSRYRDPENKKGKRRRRASDSEEEDDDDSDGDGSEEEEQPSRRGQGGLSSAVASVSRTTAQWFGGVLNTFRDPNFLDWGGFDDPKIEPSGRDFEGTQWAGVLALWDGLKIGLDFQGIGVTLDGFGKLIRSMFHKEDLVDLWRGSAGRRLLVPKGTARMSQAELRATEGLLFDTSHYTPASRYMCCVTYGNGKNGTISLFKADIDSTSSKRGSEGRHSRWPRSIRPVVAMENVPKAILRKLLSDVEPDMKTPLRVGKAGKLDWKRHGLWEKLKSRSAKRALPDDPGKYNSETISTGSIGDALEEALNLDLRRSSANCVKATVPQMLAWLHVGASVLRNVRTGAVRVDSESRRKTWRVVLLDSPPDRVGGNSRIVVLAPTESWSTKVVYWA